MVLHMYYYNFQSNQTGIEISWVISSFTLSSGFQSNQTGIEIEKSWRIWTNNGIFQSNQTGIEILESNGFTHVLL